MSLAGIFLASRPDIQKSIDFHAGKGDDSNPRPTAKMTSLRPHAIQLAKSLPPRLSTFLARYPPASILPEGVDPETAKTGYQQDTPNPFLPTKHAVTGKWHNPIYSLRRQADLVKMARDNGVEELLPHTPKGTLERLRKRVELGLRVKGTGVGQKVKGHKHERQMIAKSVLFPWRIHWGWVLALLLWVYADLDVQDGEEERSCAGHAEPYQGMEEGKTSYSLLATGYQVANTDNRLESATGPSSPGRRAGSRGLGAVFCISCNINVQLSHIQFRTQQPLSSHDTLPSVILS